MEESEVFFEGIQVTDFINLETLEHVSKTKNSVMQEK